MLILLALLSVHFVADFALQTDWMAQHKSRNWRALGIHAMVYGACFLYWGVLFACVTAVAHFTVDAATSRINGRLWQRNQRHWFFVGIGADQLTHTWILAATYQLIS